MKAMAGHLLPRRCITPWKIGEALVHRRRREHTPIAGWSTTSKQVAITQP